MMVDIFDEVGEDLRRERLAALWQRYGSWIITLAVLIVVGVGGWRAYESYALSRSAAAGDTFLAAIALSEKGDYAAAAEALESFAAEAPGNYAALARLRLASERAALFDVEPALKILESVAADQSVPQALRDLATIRAAMIAMDTEDLAGVRRRLSDIENRGSFRHMAREIITISALKAEAYSEARQEIQRMLGDPELPEIFRQRAERMEALITAAIGHEEDAAGKGS